MSGSGEKKVAIVQSNYIPWKGYFDLIHSVDEFILYDDVQYTKRDWRNRNRIKTPAGLQWLTIPIEVKGKATQAIKEAKVSSSQWGKKHWHAVLASYARTPYFKEYKEVFEPLFLSSQWEHLSEINSAFLKTVAGLLGIQTKISFSMDYPFRASAKSEQLVALCKQAGGTHYLSGPAAATYLDLQMFQSEGIEVSFFDYSGYPEYRQPYPPFEHTVSILDLIFNEGKNAPQFMKSFSKNEESK